MSAILHIVGRLGRDPETRTTNSGDTVCGFSVAVDRKVKGESVTTWYNCQVWGKQGDVAQRYLAKGRQVAVHGRFEPREYEANDGTKKVSFDVNVIGFGLIGGRDDANGDAEPRRESGGERYPSEAPKRRPIADDLDDSIPFAWISVLIAPALMVLGVA